MGCGSLRGTMGQEGSWLIFAYEFPPSRRTLQASNLPRSTFFRFCLSLSGEYLLDHHLLMGTDVAEQTFGQVGSPTVQRMVEEVVPPKRQRVMLDGQMARALEAEV